MYKRVKKTFEIIIIIVLCLSFLPVFAYATTDETDSDEEAEIQNEEIDDVMIPDNINENDTTPDEDIFDDEQAIEIEPASFEIMPMAADFSYIYHTRSDYRVYYGSTRTSYYTANGNPAFCLQPHLLGIDTGTYPVSRHITPGTGYDLLIKGAWYLYGGPGYNSVKHRLFDNPDDLLAYALSHAALAYIWSGDPASAFRGLGNADRAHLISVITHINMLPMPPGSFNVFVYNEGVSNRQTFLGWVYTPPGHLAIRKVSSNPDMSGGNSLYSLEGAVFDVYNGANQKIGSITTDANGRGRLDGIEAGQTGMYIVEVKPPKGYAQNTSQIPFEIVSGQTTTLTISNRPQNDPVAIILRKLDADTSTNTPQGGALLSGAEFTLRYYPAQYYNESELSGITPTRSWVLRTDTNGVAFLHPSYLVSGDPFYYAGNNNPALPLGTLTVQETKAPEGYLINNELYIRQITSNGVEESVFTYNAPVVPDNVIRGGVTIEKWDIERDATKLKQGDASLAGAVLEIWNRSAKRVVVNNVEYAPNTVVHTMTTDIDGWASTTNDLLPYGTYEIIEKTPPTGYLNTGTIRQTFEIRHNGVVVNLRTNDKVIKNNIIRGGVYVEKWDNEIGRNEAQGAGTLEGAIFEIVNRSADAVLVQEVLYETGEVVYTMTTDSEGQVQTDNDLLSYGTYELREISPPLRGYLATGELSRIFTIREHGVVVQMNTADTAIRNDPIRGDLRGVKISGGNAQRMGGVPFRITSVTTGESHVVVTDANGEFNTLSDWNPHSQNTNRGETDRDGIWFGEIETLNNDVGALLFDTYLIEELRCEANVGRELFEFEVSIYRHNHIINLGTLTNEYVPVPEIGTTAMDRETTTNNAIVSETTTIIDTVYYSGLQSGKWYTLKGILMDKATGEPLLIDGEEVTAEKRFRAFAVSGAVTMEFTFNSLLLGGKSVVVFESLYLDGEEIAVHADIDDEGQTVVFFGPEIGTMASGKDGNKIIPLDEEAVIIDTVSFENLVAGETYTLKGILMDKKTGEPVLVDGKTVISEVTFAAEDTSGSVEVMFSFDSTELEGLVLVVFEYLYYEDRLIAEHTDIDDEAQTVTVESKEPPPEPTPSPAPQPSPSPTPGSAPKSPQTGRDGLPVGLLITLVCLIVFAVILTIYTIKRWKLDRDE